MFEDWIELVNQYNWKDGMDNLTALNNNWHCMTYKQILHEYEWTTMYRHEWIISIIERHVIYKIYIIESECHCNAEWYELNIERIWIVDWIQMNNELIGRIKY